MLDAILYHAWFWKHAPHVLEGLGGEEPPGDGYIGLPLRQANTNGRLRYHASRAVYTQTGIEVEHWNKRPDFFGADKQQYLAMAKGVISSSIGLMRAYRMPQVIRHVKDSLLTFYAVGHKDEVQELLDMIPAVGKKAAMGWGAVDAWEVYDANNDYTMLHPEYGLMRPVPVDEMQLDGYPIMEYAIKPPYWKQANRLLCYVPVVSTNDV